MQNNPGRVYIYYATETGNAYELSVQTSILLKPKISYLQQINEKSAFVAGNFYILFISTTGQGDPPYSMRPFWKNLMNKSYPSLAGVKFCVYGLGDRSYGDNFNIMGRKMRQRLLMLKAEQVINIGLGDQQDSNGCFQQYFKAFSPKLKEYVQQNYGQQEEQQLVDEIKWKLEKINMKKNERLRVIQKKLLTSTDSRYVYWVTLKRQQEKKQKIQIGDILEIFPHNNRQIVNQMFNYFQSNKLNDINLQDDKLRKYLRESANLQNIVNFTFFISNPQWGQLYNMVDESIDSNIRQLLISKIKQLGTDYDQYFNYIKKYRRNVRQVIVDFNFKIPLSSFIKRVGPIISRKYSIAQIYPQDSLKLSLLIKLQKFKISTNRQVKGLCSYDLSFLPQSIQSNIQDQIRQGRILKNGQFSINDSFEKNLKILMISLGTGIAPFLCILGEALQNKNNWELVLFHSSRYRDQLPLEKEILQPLIGEKKLKTFITCTRQKSPIENRRIQMIIKQNKQLIRNFKEGKIFICGTKELCQFICRIFEEEVGLDVKSLKKNKVICMENW